MPAPRKKLRDALVSAFPEQSLLEQLLYFELDKNLNEITKESNLNVIVFELIRTAESQGWLVDLVLAARKQNPGNSDLAAIAIELLSPEASSVPERSPSSSATITEPKPIIQQVLSTIQDWIKYLRGELNFSFPTQYYTFLTQTCRDFNTQGLDRDFTLKLKEVFVPLKIAAEQTANVRSEMIAQLGDKANDIQECQIWDFLTPVDNGQRFRRLIVLSAPGSGKTTLLKYITLVNASKLQKGEPALIPLLLYLRDVRQKIVADNPSLAYLITEQVKDLNPSTSWFEQKLHQKQCLVMLDGLDEVADEKERQNVSRWIDKQIRKYPDTAFILTSRPNGYKAAHLKEAVLVLEVKPFNMEQIQNFIHNWYLGTEKNTRPNGEILKIEEEAKEKANRLIQSIRNSPFLATMAVNPLLLTMITTVHRRTGSLPKKRVELYKEICEVVLKKRPEEKKISDLLTLEDKQSALQTLALGLMQKKTRTFDLGEGIALIKSTKLSSKVEPKKFLENIRDISGLLVEKEVDTYEFAHLSFQEYLAAVQVNNLKFKKHLIENINTSWWAETFRLYADLSPNNAAEVIRTVLDMSSPSVDVMVLAYDCLEDNESLNSEIRQKLIQKLEEGLESTEPEIFKLAVQVRLVRRLKNLLRIDDNFYTDNNSYITCAEYQLFLDETGEPRQPQHWSNNRFPSGDAKKTIGGIRWEDANRFCVWLKSWSEFQDLSSQLTESETFYRLPTQDERNQHPIKDDQQFSDNRIRIVKFQLPSRYSQLANYLLSGEWKKADEETFSIMLQVSNKKNQSYLDPEDLKNFPCDDLRIIDMLWVYASNGRFGFSVQKNIYQNLGGTSEYNEKVWDNFDDQVGWRVNKSWIEDDSVTYDTTALKGHLPRLSPGRDSFGLLYNSLASGASIYNPTNILYNISICTHVVHIHVVLFSRVQTCKV